MRQMPNAVLPDCGFSSPKSQLVTAVKRNVRVVTTGIATESSVQRRSVVRITYEAGSKKSESGWLGLGGEIRSI